MPSSILPTIVVTGLITFVLAFFLGAEFEIEGPWRLFDRIRLGLKVYTNEFDDQTGEYYHLSTGTFFAKLFECFWCLSTWISAAVCIITVITFIQPWYFWPYEWLASIAVAGLVYIFKSK